MTVTVLTKDAFSESYSFKLVEISILINMEKILCKLHNKTGSMMHHFYSFLVLK